ASGYWTSDLLIGHRWTQSDQFAPNQAQLSFRTLQAPLSYDDGILLAQSP
ncbi:MAG: hypothetical protein ACI89X_002063, partial [Planctomycetota bacterium]